MHLLNAKSLKLESFEGAHILKYAILSHRWEEDEVTFNDIQQQRYFDKKGIAKIKGCCKQAIARGLSYVWLDTCCIDKRSSAELSESINSMYDWYAKAEVCFAYLFDIKTFGTGIVLGTGEEVNTNITTSQWFTRGWTLQELLAPSQLIFYNQNWIRLGSKATYVKQIQSRTGIPQQALRMQVHTGYSVLERMTWAADRQTTRVEDRAYSLLGLFQVNMPLPYGEGMKALKRLQEHIAAASNDISLLGWTQSPLRYSGLLGEQLQSFTAQFKTLCVGSVQADIPQTISINGDDISDFIFEESQYDLV